MRNRSRSGLTLVHQLYTAGGEPYWAILPCSPRHQRLDSTRARRSIKIHSAVAMDHVVPVVSSLDDIYASDSIHDQIQRWQRLLFNFQQTYSQPARFVARSPGRVSIIGEHIDYSLYSVLTMAMTADALLACSQAAVSTSKSSFRLRIANANPDKFPAREFDVSADRVEIDPKLHSWTNYFLCGLKGALELLRRKHGDAFQPKDIDIMMDGSVPPGGGLSSSAAFVSASALAVLYAHGEEAIPLTDLTELAITSERHVGVNSGG
jgi:galactokinase